MFHDVQFVMGNHLHMIYVEEATLTIGIQQVNYQGNHRKSLFLSVEDSLKKLQTDYIDILYIHLFVALPEWPVR